MWTVDPEKARIRRKLVRRERIAVMLWPTQESI